MSLLKFEDVNRDLDGQQEAEEDNSSFNSADIERVVRRGVHRYLYVKKEKALVGENKSLHLMAQIDMNRPEMMIKVASGGRGGLGNHDHGKDSNEAEKGYLGSSVVLQLDLKTIADIGLVGLPNAGKSSLLAAITNATPKIAPYAFTTMHPNLGVAVPKDYDLPVVKIADIPGLVEGAHINIGLGHSFLKHVYRSKVLAFVVDISSQDPFSDFLILRKELVAYDPNLKDRPFCVIANKSDLHVSTSINFPKFQKQLAELALKDPTYKNVNLFLFSSKKCIQRKLKNPRDNDDDLIPFLSGMVAKSTESITSPPNAIPEHTQDGHSK